MIRRRDIAPLLAPLLTGCGSPATRPVRIAAATNLQETYLIQLAEQLGHFRDEGLNAVIEPLVGSRQMESLISGSSDVAYQTFTGVLQFVAEGHSLQSFLVSMSALSACLAVSAKQADRIQRVEDLKGATVGVANFGSVQHQFLEFLLARHGLRPSDLTVVVYGSGTAAVAALQYGKVDAGMINGSAYTILKRRAPAVRLLVDPRTPQATKELTGVDGLPNFCLYATARWLEQNPAAARKLTRAMLRTLRWVRSHTPEQVREMLPASVRTQDAEADLESLRLLMAATSKDGRMRPDTPAGVLRYLGVTNEKVRNLRIDLAQTYTNRFVDEAAADRPEGVR